MSNKQIYYNIDQIRSKGANYNLIFGEKSNGKSYQAKLKIMLENYLNNNRRFILMRRWDADITSGWIEGYFHNMDIAKMTDNRYNTIVKYRDEIFFANNKLEEKEHRIKTTRGEKIGYAIAISMEQHYSSADFTDCDDIIVEEFMERGSYIKDEVSKFSAFYSTVDRKRGTTRVWFIGNTITKANPYIYEWGLQPVVNKMKQGDIVTLSIKNDSGNEIPFAIEYCQSSGGKSMAVGHSASMIDKGSWQSTPQPHLPKSYNEYKVIYRIGFQYQGFKFLGEYLFSKDDKSLIWFIKPFNKDFKNNIIVFSDIIKPSKYWQRDIYNITINSEKLKNILSKFRESIIFYSDDLTGSDFKEVIDFQIRR